MDLVLINIQDKKLKKNCDRYISKLLDVSRSCGIRITHLLSNAYNNSIDPLLEEKKDLTTINYVNSHLHNKIEGLVEILPIIKNEPFVFMDLETGISETDLIDFVSYSQLNTEADVIIGVTNCKEIEGFGIALDDKEMVLKVSRTMNGYTWVTKGIIYISSKRMDEFEKIMGLGADNIYSVLESLLSKGFNIRGLQV